MEYVFGCERRPQPFGAVDARALRRRIDCGDGRQCLRADDGRPELALAPEDGIAEIPGEMGVADDLYDPG